MLQDSERCAVGVTSGAHNVSSALCLARLLRGDRPSQDEGFTRRVAEPVGHHDSTIGTHRDVWEARIGFTHEKAHYTKTMTMKRGVSARAKISRSV